MACIHIPIQRLPDITPSPPLMRIPRLRIGPTVLSMTLKPLPILFPAAMTLPMGKVIDRSMVTVKAVAPLAEFAAEPENF